MKKIFCIILSILLLVCTFTACSKNETKQVPKILAGELSDKVYTNKSLKIKVSAPEEWEVFSKSELDDSDSSAGADVGGETQFFARYQDHAKEHYKSIDIIYYENSKYKDTQQWKEELKATFQSRPNAIANIEEENALTLSEHEYARMLISFTGVESSRITYLATVENGSMLVILFTGMSSGEINEFVNDNITEI